MASKKIKVKPGKTQSRIGFVVGIVFVFLGVIVVIPTFGMFGIFWTILAGLVVFGNYKNGFTDKGVATHEIIIEDGMEIEKVDGVEDIEAKLMKLNSLYEQRLITKENMMRNVKRYWKSFNWQKNMVFVAEE